MHTHADKHGYIYTDTSTQRPVQLYLRDGTGRKRRRLDLVEIRVEVPTHLSMHDACEYKQASKQASKHACMHESPPTHAVLALAERGPEAPIATITAGYRRLPPGYRVCRSIEWFFVWSLPPSGAAVG